MLKRVVDSIGEVEEQYRSLYEERDGKFYLTLEVEQSEDDKKKATDAVRKEREQRIDTEKKAKEAADRLAAFGDITPEDIAELRKAKEDAAEAERKRQEETAKSREEWQALIQAERERGEKKLKDQTEPLKADVAELNAVIEHMVRTTAFAKAAAELPVKPNFVDLFMSYVDKHAKTERQSNGAGETIMVAGKQIRIPEVVVYVDDIPVQFGEWAKNHFAKSKMGTEIVLEPQDEGGGANGSVAGTQKREKNPWLPGGNLTRRGQIRRENPALADRLKAEADALAR